MVNDEKITTEGKSEEKIIGDITEAKMTEEKMGREEIIENHIDYIRKASKLSDEEMKSLLNDAIDDDEELSDILEKFAHKIEKINDDITYVLSNKEDESKEDKENSAEIEDILQAFEDENYAYPLEEIIESLRDEGYADPGAVVVDSINDGILCVDSIEDDDVVYIALTKEGEELWRSHNN